MAESAAHVEDVIPSWYRAASEEMMARMTALIRGAPPLSALPAGSIPPGGNFPTEVETAGVSAGTNPMGTLKDPPLFTDKMNVPNFLSWRDKFILFSRRGGLTSAESAIASSNRFTLLSHWFSARESLPDIPEYEVAAMICSSDLRAANQEKWMSWLEQVIRFNTSETSTVRPRFDTFKLEWLDECSLDLEALAEATRLRVLNPETWDTEDHFQASVISFRRTLETNGFVSIANDLGHAAGAQKTASMTPEERWKTLKFLIEKYEHRLRQATIAIKEHKQWVASPAGQLILFGPNAAAAAAAQAHTPYNKSNQRSNKRRGNFSAKFKKATKPAPAPAAAIPGPAPAAASAAAVTAPAAPSTK